MYLCIFSKDQFVAAANPLSGWPRGPMLTAHTSPLPPHTWGPGSVNQHASHVGGQTSQRSQFTCPVYIATYHPIKPVRSEPLSITVPVVIGTCMVLVGTVESVPVPPQYDISFKSV